jgi:hypothetical protein
MKDVEIKHRWREYFDKLFNGKTESSTMKLTTPLMISAGVLGGNPGV